MTRIKLDLLILSQDLNVTEPHVVSYFLLFWNYKKNQFVRHPMWIDQQADERAAKIVTEVSAVATGT